MTVDLPDITPERVAELRKKAREVMAKSRAEKEAAKHSAYANRACLALVMA
jgi:hypothetical protein